MPLFRDFFNEDYLLFEIHDLFETEIYKIVEQDYTKKETEKIMNKTIWKVKEEHPRIYTKVANLMDEVFEQYCIDIMTKYFDISTGIIGENEKFVIIHGGQDDISKFIKELNENIAHDINIEDLLFSIFGAEEYGFDDEYVKCDDCIDSRIINLYEDKYFRGETGIFCEECIKNDKDLELIYIEQLINNPEAANQLLETSRLEVYGFKKINKEVNRSSMHEGRGKDDPRELLEKAHNEGYNEVVFNLEHFNPFETEFTTWVRSK